MGQTLNFFSLHKFVTECLFFFMLLALQTVTMLHLHCSVLQNKSIYLKFQQSTTVGVSFDGVMCVSCKLSQKISRFQFLIGITFAFVCLHLFTVKNSFVFLSTSNAAFLPLKFIKTFQTYLRGCYKLSFFHHQIYFFKGIFLVVEILEVMETLKCMFPNVIELFTLQNIKHCAQGFFLD